MRLDKAVDLNVGSDVRITLLSKAAKQKLDTEGRHRLHTLFAGTSTTRNDAPLCIRQSILLCITIRMVCASRTWPGCG